MVNIKNAMELVIETVEEAIYTPTRVGYGELLQQENVKGLETQKPDLWNTLNAFAHGTYSDFSPSTSLAEPVAMKLRQLTILSMAAKERRLSYDSLLSALKLETDRAVEDLIIDAMYKGLLRGRLNSKDRCVEVEEWQPRDLPLEKLHEVKQAFYACLNNVEHVVTECNKMAANEENNAFVQNEEENARQERIANARKEVEEEMRSVINMPGFMGAPRGFMGMPGTSVQKEKRKMFRKGFGGLFK